MNNICIIGGCGHVGLPLGLALADAGNNVVLYDINQTSVDLVNNSKMPFLDKNADQTLAKVIHKTLTASTHPVHIKDAEFIIIVVGTPIDEHLNPIYGDIEKLINNISPYLHNGQVIILRSTVYPGTTNRIQSFLQENSIPVQLAFCPERVAEGLALEEINSLPQIISSFDTKTLNKVSSLFKTLGVETIELQPLEAELAKLFTNNYRYITFAIANNFYTIAAKHGLDYNKIYKAMTYKYPRLAKMPKPGLTGGACLIKDCMQTSSFSTNEFFLGHTAMVINEGIPNFIVDYILKNTPISSVIGILGMAFKAESDDARDSLAFKLKKLLLAKGYKTLCSDEYLRKPYFISKQDLVNQSNIIIIGCPHSAYKELDFSSKEIIDIWGYLK